MIPAYDLSRLVIRITDLFAKRTVLISNGQGSFQVIVRMLSKLKETFETIPKLPEFSSSQLTDHPTMIFPSSLGGPVFLNELFQGNEMSSVINPAYGRTQAGFVYSLINKPLGKFVKVYGVKGQTSP